MPQIENERSFLVRRLPNNLTDYRHTYIAQGYIARNVAGDEFRVRKADGRYTAGIKLGAGQKRRESTVVISEEMFLRLWPLTVGGRIWKIRYQIPHGARLVELDVYRKQLKGLVVAEVEFSSEKESREFVPLKWFGREVTRDWRYSNQQLAQYGIPKKSRARAEQRRGAVIPRYGLRDGIKRLIDLIEEDFLLHYRPTIVLIGGGSASGKTMMVAEKIRSAVGNNAASEIVSADNYNRGREYKRCENERGNAVTWDDPQIYDYELFLSHLKRLSWYRPVEKKIFDFRTCEHGVDDKAIKPGRVIIGEGLHVLDKRLSGDREIKAFVDADVHSRMLRRIVRDMNRTGQPAGKILKYFCTVVEPRHRRYIESSKKNADLIIENNDRFPVKSGEQERKRRLKFETALGADDLVNLGAVTLRCVHQKDDYYLAGGRNNMSELVRIRKEGAGLIWSGLVGENVCRRRKVLSFPIDQETEVAFAAVYGRVVKTIFKFRCVYCLDGVKFCVDYNVIRLTENKMKKLGDFIELERVDTERAKRLLKILGLKKEAEKFYFEM